jgi:hypothetical protein
LNQATKKKVQQEKEKPPSDCNSLASSWNRQEKVLVADFWVQSLGRYML